MILLKLCVSVSSILLSGHDKVLVRQEHVHYFPTKYETAMGFWNTCRRDAQEGFANTLHKPLKQIDLTPEPAGDTKTDFTHHRRNEAIPNEPKQEQRHTSPPLSPLKHHRPRSSHNYRHAPSPYLERRHYPLRSNNPNPPFPTKPPSHTHPRPTHPSACYN